MSKKGFTLVEILAVIVILSLIIVIITTNGFGAFNKVSEKVEVETVKSIYESVNLLMTDVENCDDDINTDIIETFVGVNKKCKDLKRKLNNECLYVKLEDLINKGYITGDNVIEFNKKNNGLEFEVCNIINKDESKNYITCTNNCDNYDKIVETEDFVVESKKDNSADIIMAAKQYIRDLLVKKEGINLYYKNSFDSVYHSLLSDDGFSIDINLLKNSNYYNGNCDFFRKDFYVNSEGKECVKYDLNKDAYVDYIDSQLLQDHLGEVVKAEKNNAIFDFDNDRNVQLSDLSIHSSWIKENCENDCDTGFLQDKRVSCFLCDKYDFTGDGRVTEADANELISQIGYSKTDSKYDVKYDLDNNDGISLSDLNILLNCYTKKGEIVLKLECVSSNCDSYLNHDYSDMSLDNFIMDVKLNTDEYDLKCN